MKHKLWFTVITCLAYCIDKELWKAIEYLKEQVRVLKEQQEDDKRILLNNHHPHRQWHRVAQVWDCTNRALHMDGVEVERDTQTNLVVASGSLRIGAGKSLGTDSYWSGLIDDVWIYDRVVKP